MQLTDSVKALKRVGDKTAKLFAKLNILTLRDLLHDFPRDYDVLEPVSAIDSLVSNRRAVIRGQIMAAKPARTRTGKSLLTLSVRDQTGSLTILFFNQPYLLQKCRPGSFYYFRGTAKESGRGLSMEQPVIYTREEYEGLQDAIQPVYGLTKGLTNRMVTSCVRQTLEQAEPEEEYLPEYILKGEGLCGLREAYRGIHFPENFEEAARARRRLVFDELFLFTYMVRRQKGYSEQIPNSYPMPREAAVKKLMGELPYELTKPQKRTLQEVLADLESPYTMNRLIQGDVGSGKTIIALLALLKCVENGYQGALMAPTEVLAEQHMENFCKMTEEHQLPFRPVLLTGALTAASKREAYRQISQGEANVIIGTHALIQEKVVYKKLALVITDEQHRFGVRQREALGQKGGCSHVLVMSATPIPRSLAIILYGDLNLSVIDELPVGRLPRKNCVVTTTGRPASWRFLEKEVRKGHQAYVICPMVEPGEREDSQLENVVDYSQSLREALPPEIRITYLHGRMRPAQKQQIMEAFYAHEIDILVSTTVIEVGIDVPNATVIMVENAERFGLAALHQLRGRVGRGPEQSYCIFVASKDDEKTMERLNILNRSNDGFFIANEDLRLRGPGDLFGLQQSGDFPFELADIYQDASVLKRCSELVDQLMKEDPLLTREEHRSLASHFSSGAWNRLDFRTI
ncbi:MAG: ATP-dependent DNA helicase RecG [Lachnospiraceae bacterium]|nr:ATP-dependent DNA helicase RecG [Lachnospiraceae bacterium]